MSAFVVHNVIEIIQNVFRGLMRVFIVCIKSMKICVHFFGKQNHNDVDKCLKLPSRIEEEPTYIIVFLKFIQRCFVFELL